MTPRWAKILGAALLLLAGAWAGYRLATRPEAPPSTPIVLPDGSWVQIEAVTFGTNHLVGPPLSQLAHRAPLTVRVLLARIFGRAAVMRFTHTTAAPKLVLWLNRGISAGPFPASLGRLECVLSDTNGLAGGEIIPFPARYPLTVTEFDVFPRRSPLITLSIFHHDTNGVVTERGSVTFANPVYRGYPVWNPEPLPATKRAGDVSVTLDRIVTGLAWDYQRATTSGSRALVFTPSLPGGTNATVCRLRVDSLANTNQIWRVAGVNVSDATGNHTASTRLVTDEDEGYVEFHPGLWSSEPAWKLDMELKRIAGFEPDELVTFHGVPFGGPDSTNRLGWTTNCGGISITLTHVAQRKIYAWPANQPVTVDWQLGVDATGLTNNLRLDLVSARTDTGVELAQFAEGGNGRRRSFNFSPPPPGAKLADVTFAVQRSRRVEFLVRPERGAMQFDIPEANRR